MEEPIERTDRDDDEQHPLESEEALREPRKVAEDEQDRDPESGLTPDDDASIASFEGGLVRHTVPARRPPGAGARGRAREDPLDRARLPARTNTLSHQQPSTAS
jgi:hypothetical protein